MPPTSLRCMESRSFHLAEEAHDCCGRMQAQVLANIAAAGDLAAQQQRRRVQRTGAADDILGLDDKLEAVPA